ncbi:ExeM/NucH family extracellular endonuclease [Euzebya sp.]|uniref:ExeM/NucH family extracellular endonuclease n=1 Tax=Euzebya sp. TaxID=1971409 RepID=UPI0035114ED1
MSLRRPLGLLSLLALIASLLALAPVVPAGAQATDLIFSEYVEGSSFNKAIEIYNGTDAAVDLDDGGYVLELYSNGAATPSQSTALAGTVAAGDVLVGAHASAGPSILAVADFTNSSVVNWNGDDAIVLRAGGQVVDSIGQVGTDPGSQWGSGDASTADNTLRRMDDVCGGDTVADDDFDPADEWDGFAQDTFDGLGSHDGCSGPQAPVINEFSASTTGTDVEFLELFGEPSTDYSNLTILEIEGDGPAPGTVDSAVAMGTTDEAGFFLRTLRANEFENGTITLLLVAGFTGDASDDLDSDDDGVLDVTPWTGIVDSVAVDDGGSGDVSYSSAVLEAEYDGLPFAPGGASRIPDGVDTDSAEDWVRNDFDLAGIEGNPGSPVPGEAYNTPGEPNEVVEEDGGGGEDPLEGTPALIHEVQGDGADAALFGATVEVSGIVTSLFESGDQPDGFFVQEEDEDADTDPDTSEGIFVFCRGFCLAEVAVGDQVTVDGVVDEYFGMTQLAPASAADIIIDSVGNALPTAVELTLPAGGSTTDAATYEAVEGMVVTYTDTLAVSETFEYARYGQIVLADESRPYQYTHIDPSPTAAEYDDYLEELATQRIILDDDNNTQNDAVNGPESDEPLPYPSSSWPDGGLSTEDYFRGGDTITGLTAVMHWSFAGQSGTDAWRLRPIDGEAYTFESTNPRTASPADTGGTLTVASFNVLNYFPTPDTGAAVCGPDDNQDCRGASSEAEFERQEAKIVAALAAMDADIVGLIEIENDATAVQALVDALNAEVGAGTYAQIDTGAIGTDAIKVGFIYQPATVEPVGDFDLLDASDDARFDDDRNRPMLTQTFREVATGEVFTASVNHLKSKGSGCGAGDDAPEIGAGSCNGTRTAAAEAIIDHLAGDPTGSGDPDFLILGDLNSYRMEDPIDVLEGGGYVDLLEALIGDEAYSYEFDGQLGYLDYALANDSLFDQVTGVDAWHINADELPLFDYNDTVLDPGEQSFEREPAALPLYESDPYRSSDHDPVIVGLDLGGEVPAPVADAGGPYEVRVGGRTVTLDASASTGEDLEFAWDLDGDGEFDDADGPTATFRGNRPPRTYTVSVQVTDGSGQTDTDSTTVRVYTPGRGNGGNPPGQGGPPHRGR